jgi:hypothetical protein
MAGDAHGLAFVLLCKKSVKSAPVHGPVPIIFAIVRVRLARMQRQVNASNACGDQ